MIIETIEDCDALFDVYALRRKALDVKTAAAKKRLAELKAKLDAETAEEETALAEMKASIKAWDEAHPEFYTDPRKRKCVNGAHGLQSGTVLEYDSASTEEEKAALAEAEGDRLGIELCRRKVTADDTAIMTALEGGEDVRGVRLRHTVTGVISIKLAKAKE